MRDKRSQTVSATRALVAKSKGFAADVYEKLYDHVVQTGVPFGNNDEICKWLHLKKVKTARGKDRWQVIQVSRMLKKLTPEQSEFLFKYKGQGGSDDEYEDEDDLKYYAEFLTSNVY